MAQVEATRPSRTFRGTWDQVLACSKDIARTSRVELRVFDEAPQENGSLPDPDNDPTIALLKSWIAQAPTDPEEIRLAEEELREFKRNMNANRVATGEEILYPDVEE